MFSVLKEKELELIDRNKYTVTFKKGETIHKQGTFLSHIVSLNSGLAKLYLEGTGVSNGIIRIIKPTNFIGGPGIYFDKIHHYTVTALQDSTEPSAKSDSTDTGGQPRRSVLQAHGTVPCFTSLRIMES